MRELLDRIEARQRLVRETVERLREQITELTEQLASAERTLERLETTRETVLELATEEGAPPPEPLPPGYREILALFEQNGDGLRAKDEAQAACRAPDPGRDRAGLVHPAAAISRQASPRPVHPPERSDGSGINSHTAPWQGGAVRSPWRPAEAASSCSYSSC
ncbi:hypothetical protein OOK36_54765 [Streptomyces sp. NBC_00365]|uniref:hypothetical protein n=1 Tax=Streptomyces sp. NBC_00365 TaxID=2975726 RepID=UPI00225511BD|nr:hypothetical protein [Streptomyces sp. NBC_00365]MCX5097534.1 hypothetical protein [Streptomyces sp. NBC_00365]